MPPALPGGWTCFCTHVFYKNNRFAIRKVRGDAKVGYTVSTHLSVVAVKTYWQVTSHGITRRFTKTDYGLNAEVAAHLFANMLDEAKSKTSTLKTVQAKAMLKENGMKGLL